MKAKTVKEVLIAARWILKHHGWCQKSYAFDANGKPVLECSPQAVSFCLSGALLVVDTDWELSVAARNLVSGELDTSPISFNDKEGRTKQEVLDLLDRVIARAT